jgi:hypothetical protein
MRTIIEFDDKTSPVTLRMYIHGAPHRRAHREILRLYRISLWEAWKAADRADTIKVPVDLSVTFINPTGPDLDNLLTALFQALDAKTGKGPTILADDRLVSYVRMGLLRS